jgi:hypothetical protein
MKRSGCSASPEYARSSSRVARIMAQAASAIARAR